MLLINELIIADPSNKSIDERQFRSEQANGSSSTNEMLKPYGEKAIHDVTFARSGATR